VLAGDAIGSVGVALAFALALLAMVHTGPISGAHLNPAVTVAVVAPLLGSVCAASLHELIAHRELRSACAPP
jgi:glycerol uptake facilitator-like aquaporin